MGNKKSDGRNLMLPLQVNGAVSPQHGKKGMAKFSGIFIALLRHKRIADASYRYEAGRLFITR
jgi:hypothetical protein